MITLATDTVRNDLIVKDGNLLLYSDTDQIGQSVREALGMFFGEWFLNNKEGVPWFQEILVANPNLGTIQAILLQVVLNVPGVGSLNSFTFDFVPKTRALFIVMEIKTTNGQTINLEKTVGV